MKKTASVVTTLLILATALLSPSFAATNTGDPNVEVRKLTSGGQNPALVEFERVKKLNNDANIAHFGAVLKKNPKDADAYAKRGKAYSGNKDYDKAVKLDPKIPDAYIGRAVVYLMRKDYGKSWENVHKAESLGGKFWPAFTDALKKSSGRDK